MRTKYLTNYSIIENFQDKASEEKVFEIGIRNGIILKRLSTFQM